MIFFPVLEHVKHGKFDIAVGRAPRAAVGDVFERYTGPIGLGLDVQAFGFTDGGKESGQIAIDPRLLRGHVSRCAQDSFGLPSPSLIEVSFGSPSGFSGTPLLVNTQIVGVMYSNLDSRLQAYSMMETNDGGSQYRETAYRIYEFGIAHRISDLDGFFSECAVGIDSKFLSTI